MRTHVPDPDVIQIEANGLELAALTWGGSGPLVLMIHGFPDTPRTWDVVGPRVAAAGFRVVAPYTRGIAPSQAPVGDAYDSDTLGTDVLALIEALGEAQAIVVGHDFGASAAYSAAGLQPERVRKLVTVAIPHPASLRPSLRKLWGVRHFFTHRLPGAARRFAAHDFAQVRTLYERWSPGFDWPDSELEAVKNAYAAEGCTRAALGYYRALSVSVPPGLRARIEVPSLVVGGRTDGVADEADFRRSVQRFRGEIQVEMLPGGHFLHREHPEPFLEVLLAFLGEPGAS